MTKKMKLTDFDYLLPQNLIAQYPLKERQAARLMVVDRRRKTIRHDTFGGICGYLPAQSRIVLNNSKVVPVRLLGRKAATEGKFEIFLLKKLWDDYTYKVLMRPLKRVKVGDIIKFNGSRTTARIMDIPNRIVRFNRRDIFKKLDTLGHMPLPPYIRRPDNTEDREFYQTVYARYPGSVAAPTAGLHFTKGILKELKGLGHKFERVTLHINYATFKPVEAEDIRTHKMHSESYSVSPQVWLRLKQARDARQKIVAVGTTSCRVLETVAASSRLRGSTGLFIYPGYRFTMVDALLTNFHLPRSTLFMLVSAFAGTELIRRAYEEAIREEYRFYSYGDAMLIL